MAIDLRGRSVLVVDDEPLIRAVFRRVLTRAGVEVQEAASVAEACELLAGGARIDVLVTDMLMPGLSGLELIEWVKPRWPRLPVIMITAVPEQIPAGAAALVLSKPVTGAQLTDAVTEVLTEHRATTRMPKLPRS
jgi:CheY-like chemotaxis protein